MCAILCLRLFATFGKHGLHGCFEWARIVLHYGQHGYWVYVTLMEGSSTASRITACRICRSISCSGTRLIRRPVVSARRRCSGPPQRHVLAELVQQHHRVEIGVRVPFPGGVGEACASGGFLGRWIGCGLTGRAPGYVLSAGGGSSCQWRWWPRCGAIH